MVSPDGSSRQPEAFEGAMNIHGISQHLHSQSQRPVNDKEQAGNCALRFVSNVLQPVLLQVLAGLNTRMAASQISTCTQLEYLGIVRINGYIGKKNWKAITPTSD